MRALQPGSKWALVHVGVCVWVCGWVIPTAPAAKCDPCLTSTACLDPHPLPLPIRSQETLRSGELLELPLHKRYSVVTAKFSSLFPDTFDRAVPVIKHM